MFVIGSAVAFAPPSFAGEPAHDITFVQDFDELWRTLAERYCYFGEKTTDWPRASVRFWAFSHRTPCSCAAVKSCLSAATAMSSASALLR